MSFTNDISLYPYHEGKEGNEYVTKVCPNCWAEVEDLSQGCPICSYPCFDHNEYEIVDAE